MKDATNSQVLTSNISFLAQYLYILLNFLLLMTLIIFTWLRTRSLRVSLKAGARDSFGFGSLELSGSHTELRQGKYSTPKIPICPFKAALLE